MIKVLHALAETVKASWPDEVMQLDDDSIYFVNPGCRIAKYLYFRAFNVNF